jgi:endonuclease YncB( thermonuclease family)
MTRPIFLLLTVLLAPAAPAQALPLFTGEVTGVPHGDILLVTHEGKVAQVRLHGVVAPEKSQPHAEEARAALEKLALGKTVRVIPMGKDRQKRISADVRLDDQSLNDRMMRDGWGWFNFRQSKDRRLRTLQAAAKAERKGLWADTDPIPPWDWARGVRPVKPN